METFKLDKSAAVMTFRRLRNLSRLFRFAEFCAAVALLAWLSSRAPLAAKASGDYLRRISSAVASPVFVFFLGNAIVVALFAKSGHLSRSSSVANNAGSQIYDELLSDVPKPAIPPPEDKEMIVIDPSVPEVDSIEKPRVSESDNQNLERDNSVEEEERKACSEIVRRLETDLCQETVNDVGSGELEDSEEGMSNEEFRRTIEEFIAKQVKFRRQESYSVVVQAHA